MDADGRFVAVRVDDENNAEEWWRLLRGNRPDVAAALERDGVAVVSATLWKRLASMPGFAEGPSHAPFALLHGRPGSPEWEGIVAQRHQVLLG